jgi:hypothetical protein
MAALGHFDVVGVLAGVYRGQGRRGTLREDQTCLTHAVERDADGYIARVLCGRVAVDHLCNEAEGTVPTCAVCAKRLARLMARPKPALTHAQRTMLACIAEGRRPRWRDPWKCAGLRVVLLEAGLIYYDSSFACHVTPSGRAALAGGGR